MDLKQLEYFVRVVELGGFTRAAQALGVTQPSLSRQVRLLELELHEHLLYRTGRGAEPTEAGRLLFEYGSAMLKLASRAKQDIDNLKRMPRGRISVGLPPRLAHLLTPVLVESFRRQLPGASITVSEGPSVKMREWLLDGQIDVALFYDPAPNAKLDYESIFREELVLVGKSPGVGTTLPARVKLSQLQAFPVVLPCMPNTIRVIVDTTCRSRDVQLDIVAEVNAVHTLVAVVEQGHSFGILPISAVSRQIREGTLGASRIESPTMRNHLVLATSRAKSDTRLTTETLQLIREMNVSKLLQNV
ncbi:LysR family transcriptional regulator [Pigmentiphaga humi]|uniref:LysR family transcriptional regulator n=1 Tax=Pigmentiphaga humi TaxID=2478468 RepID=UPI000F536A0A|nr:LysR family transcriptional regulator [Pigmentiphaga humi]